MTLLERLILVYPEFKPLSLTDEQKEQWEVFFHKAKCLFPRFKNVSDDNGKCELALPLFMLTAHLFVMAGLGESESIQGGGGLVNSSSVGDVSVSFSEAPYQSSGTPSFDYYYSQTKYGQEFLAWLQMQSGLKYVNN